MLLFSPQKARFYKDLPVSIDFSIFRRSRIHLMNPDRPAEAACILPAKTGGTGLRTGV
jgi:hypothetical protein